MTGTGSIEERVSIPPGRWGVFLLTILVIPAALLFAYRWAPALSHGMTEMFSIVVACSVFMLTWNARNIIDNNYFIFLGIAYLFVGAFDFIHLLSFVGSFNPGRSTSSLTLWYSGRFVQSIALISAPSFVSRRIRPWFVFLMFSAISILLVALSRAGVFPVFQLFGEGSTPSAGLPDYLIVGIQVLSVGAIWRVREHFDREVFQRLVVSTFFSIAAELSDDLQTGRFEYGTLLGHYLNVVSYYLVYKAIVATGLIRPYDLMFRNLKKSEEDLRIARDEMERKVGERTEELQAVNEHLEVELAERKRAVEMRQLILDLHHLTHTRESVRDFLSSVSEFLQQRFGFKAIGIRYRRGDDYPYFEVRGFPREFVDAEMSLCSKGRGPSYECACGAVIVGGFDPSLPFFTPYGTFWTNCASELANGAGEAVITRGRCVRQGYESIALVPLRFGGVTFGLLQFNDRRKEVFHPNLLEQLERVAENVAAALGRLLAWEALQEIEDRFRSLVENSLVGIFIVTDGRIVFRNPQMENIFGKVPEGFPFRELGPVHPDDTEEFERLCAATEESGPERRESDVRFFIPEGEALRSVRWLHCQANPIVFRGAASLLIDMVDITRVKELEQTVTAREKLASIGQLAAGIAHEIRNPLSGININVSTLDLLCRKAEGLAPEEREKIDAVVAQTKVASEKISSVIGRVMEFSKPSPPRMDRLDVNRIVRDALSLSEIMRRKGRVEFRKAMSPDPLPCQGDPALLEQVILNLVTNAVQAMESVDGPGVITIGTAREGDKAVIRVADTGPGIPEHLRKKIFEPFFTTRKEGHGIGLSFCHRIVSDHGGRLSAGAADGGGAEFRIELPLTGERSPT